MSIGNTKQLTWRGAVVECLSGLVMVQKVAIKREFEAGLRHVMTGKLSLSTQQ